MSGYLSGVLAIFCVNLIFAYGIFVTAAAGQINLDQLAPEARSRLAAALGVKPDQRAALLDRLADDMDPDDLKHIQGAEAADYLAVGLAPPRNRPFVSPAEALGVLGWRELVPRPAWTALADQITAEPVQADAP